MSRQAKIGERLPYLLASLKAPRIGERLAATAERAREEKWPYEQFLEVLLEAEVFAREASGPRQRTRHAGFPAHKTLEDFDFTAQPSAERPLVMHLAQLAWIEEHANVCLIGNPGTGKTHCEGIALGIKACQRGYRVAFATAQQWVSRLEEAQERNTLDQELKPLERYQLLIVDEVGYLPLERQAANLLFALVSRRYERGSIIITSNRGFEAWGEILGNAMVAAALIDRLVHHATMVTLWHASDRALEHAVHQHSGREHRSDQAQHLAVGHPVSNQVDHPLVRERPEEIRDVAVHDPLRLPQLPPDPPHGHMRRAPRAVAEARLPERRLNDRRKHLDQRLLAHPIHHSGNA
jgi:DNA replication protein DnaC